MKKKRNGIKMHFHGEDRNDSGLKVRNGFGDEEWRGNICRRRKDLCDFKLWVIVRSNTGFENLIRRNLPVYEMRSDVKKKKKRRRRNGSDLEKHFRRNLGLISVNRVTSGDSSWEFSAK